MGQRRSWPVFTFLFAAYILFSYVTVGMDEVRHLENCQIKW